MNLKKIEKELKELFPDITFDEGYKKARVCSPIDFDIVCDTTYVYIAVYEYIPEFDSRIKVELADYKTYQGLLKALKKIKKAFNKAIEISDKEYA